MMISLAIPVTAPERGWGGPLAILIAFTVMGVIHIGFERRKNRASHSPPPPDGRGHGANPQVIEGSDPDNPADEDAEIVQHGAYTIDYSDGRSRQRVRISRAPNEPVRPTLDGWVRQKLGKLGTNELIRQGSEQFRKSPSTVKRALRRARDDG